MKHLMPDRQYYGHRTRRQGRPCPAGLIGTTEVGELLLRASRVLGGVSKLAAALGVQYQSIYGWATRGSLPASEWTGQTRYALDIDRITQGEVSAVDLLRHKPPARRRTEAA